jgi:ABC-type polysaccharide transport system permease subunit
VEPQKKIKINAISSLIILFDVLSIGKWIISHDFERIEKQAPNKQQVSNAF